MVDDSLFVILVILVIFESMVIVNGWVEVSVDPVFDFTSLDFVFLIVHCSYFGEELQCPQNLIETYLRLLDNIKNTQILFIIISIFPANHIYPAINGNINITINELIVVNELNITLNHIIVLNLLFFTTFWSNELPNAFFNGYKNRNKNNTQFIISMIAPNSNNHGKYVDITHDVISSFGAPSKNTKINMDHNNQYDPI